MQRTGIGAYSSPDIRAAALKDQGFLFPYNSKAVLENRGDGGRMGFPARAEKREGRK